MERAFTALGPAIRRARLRAGMSIERCAINAYTTAASLTTWETGHRDPSLQALSRLAEVLGTTVVELLEDSETADDESELAVS